MDWEVSASNSLSYNGPFLMGVCIIVGAVIDNCFLISRFILYSILRAASTNLQPIDS